MARPTGRKWRRAMGWLGALAAGLAAWACATRDPEWPILAAWSVPPASFRVGLTMDGQVSTEGIGFSPDGRRFFTKNCMGGPIDGAAWDVATGRRVADDLGEALLDPIRSRDGRWAVGWRPSGGPGDACLVQVDLASGRVVRRFLDAPHHPPRPGADSSGDGWGNFMPNVGDSGLPAIALVDGDRTIQLLGRAALMATPCVRTIDVATGAASDRSVARPWSRGIADLTGPYAATRDGRILAYAVMNREQLQLWDAVEGRPIGARVGARYDTWMLSKYKTQGGWQFTPDGRTLILPAAPGRPNEVEVRDVTEGGVGRARAIAVASPGFRIGRLEVAPDGRTVAAWGVDSRPPATNWLVEFAARHVPGWPVRSRVEVVVTDLRTGERLARAAGAFAPHYAPDGRTIVTAERGDRYAVRAVPPPSPGQ